jgi:outer membrane receptor protein involved in Fe transport
VAWNYEFFVQDSWKASKNFTLEYGLRVGKWTNNVETNGLGAIFDPRATTRTRVLPRSREDGSSTAWPTRRRSAGPHRFPAAL